MPTLSTPRVILAGTHAGVGKSLLATGLAVALRKRGVSVSCCVTGRSVHQGLILNRIVRRNSRTLDRRLLTPPQILYSLYQAGLGSDIILIDGHAGFYDGIGVGDVRGSDCEVAAITKTPSVLVADIRGYSNSVAALIKGYSHLHGDAGVRGVVANHVLAAFDADPFSPNPEVVQLNECMKKYKLPPLVGGITEAGFGVPLPRHPFSQDENRTSLPMQFYLDIGGLITNHVDIDKILAIAQSAPEIELPDDTLEPQNRRCRIAVSDDSCFNATFQDNIDLLRYFGAEIVTFSPLADSELPRNISMVYLTGAYLKNYGGELTQNVSIRSAINNFAKGGGVVFSEGAGTAFLSRSFQIERGGEFLPGIGLLPIDVGVLASQSNASKDGINFLEARLIEDCILGKGDTLIQGVSLSDFGVRVLDFDTARTLRQTAQITVDGVEEFQEGYAPLPGVFSSFQFLHFGSAPHVAKNLVEVAASVGKTPS